MPTEQSRPERPPIGDSAIPVETGRPESGNPEAGPKLDVSRRQASNEEVTLDDNGADFFKFFKKVFNKGVKYEATLKNGKSVDMAFAYEAWETLNDLLSERPDLIVAAQSKLRGEKISPLMRRELRRQYLTGRDGELLPYIRDVLSSGYKETKDGPVIVNPFNLEKEADRQAFEELEKIDERNISRFLRSTGLLPDDSGGPPLTER
jgi:hypothetical protein